MSGSGSASGNNAGKKTSMRVQFHAHDRAPLEWGLEKISKMSGNIVKMSTFIRIESHSAARHAGACEKAKTFLATTGERPEGFTGEIEVDNDVREVLYTSSLAWLREVNDNIAPDQTKLTIATSETDKRRAQVESLRDRLEGIIGIFDSVPTPPAAS